MSLGPTGIAASGDIGGPTGDAPAPRLVIGGGSGSRDASDRMTATGDVQAAYAPAPSSRSFAQTRVLATRQSVQGPFLVDGTLLKPVAVDTTVGDGRDLVRSYAVKSGDTLEGIARQFGVSVMSVWWANKLKSKDDLRGGLILRIPPVNGLIVTVESNETLSRIARTYDVDQAEILAVNRLDDPSLVVGQVLIMP
ncbi:MAG: LysM peptidoglycan-binding domain-containing protein, partial [Candidatus Limnocylindria bacterium]